MGGERAHEVLGFLVWFAWLPACVAASAPAFCLSGHCARVSRQVRVFQQMDFSHGLPQQFARAAARRDCAAATRAALLAPQ